MSNSSPAVSEDDLLAISTLGVLAFATGIFSFGMFLDPLRNWMLQYHLLEHGHTVVIPIIDGAGLGWGQILVVAAVLLLAIALGVLAHRHRRSRV